MDPSRSVECGDRLWERAGSVARTPDDRRRAQLVWGLSTAFLALAVFFAFQTLWIGAPKSVIWICAAGALLFTGNLGALRLFGVGVAAAALFTEILALLLITAATGGGLALVAGPWNVLVPLLAVYLLGVRTGLATSAFLLAEGVAFYYLEVTRRLASRPIGPGTELLSALGALALITCIAILYEASRKTAEEALVRAVTLRQRAYEDERRLLEAQAAIQLRDDFLAIAGHELKTPLSALLLQLQGLQRRLRPDTPPEIANRLEKATKSGLRLERLTVQLLDVSRIAAGKLCLEPEPFDLVELAREVVVRFADVIRQPQVQLSLSGPPKLEGVWDRPRIDQVLTNLIGNAIKYGLGRPVEVALALEGGAVVRVTDHGIGVEAEQRLKIFQRFERAVTAREFGGFGIGLWIAKQIVVESGGTIEVESEPGHGATFTVRLPLSQSEALHAVS